MIEICIPEGVKIRLNSLPVDALKEPGSRLYWGPPVPPPAHKTDTVKIVVRTPEEFYAALAETDQHITE